MNILSLMYAKYLPIAYILILLNWFFTKGRIDWQSKDFLLPLIVSPIWLGLFYVIAHSPLNRGKGLANLSSEPIYLGIGIGIVYIFSTIFFSSGSSIKTKVLIIGMLILILALTFLFPVLPGDM